MSQLIKSRATLSILLSTLLILGPGVRHSTYGQLSEGEKIGIGSAVGTVTLGLIAGGIYYGRRGSNALNTMKYPENTIQSMSIDEAILEAYDDLTEYTATDMNLLLEDINNGAFNINDLPNINEEFWTSIEAVNELLNNPSIEYAYPHRIESIETIVMDIRYRLNKIDETLENNVIGIGHEFRQELDQLRSEAYRINYPQWNYDTSRKFLNDPFLSKKMILKEESTLDYISALNESGYPSEISSLIAYYLKYDDESDFELVLSNDQKPPTRWRISSPKDVSEYYRDDILDNSGENISNMLIEDKAFFSELGNNMEIAVDISTLYDQRAIIKYVNYWRSTFDNDIIILKDLLEENNLYDDNAAFFIEFENEARRTMYGHIFEDFWQFSISKPIFNDIDIMVQKWAQRGKDLKSFGKKLICQ